MNQRKTFAGSLFLLVSTFAIAACDRSSDGTLTETRTMPPVESSDRDSSTAKGSAATVTHEISYSQFMNDPVRSSETVSKRYEGSNSISWDSKYCAKGVDCVNRVVNIYTKLGSCEGVLVTKDTVLTNRHCVEPIISDGQFSGLIAVMAPMKRARREAIGS